MLQRSGSLRRTGFKRPIYTPPPSPPVTRGRGGVIQRITDTVVSAQKENVITSLVYQALVRTLPCARCGIVGFTQFCHSDEGKGLGIKTDDRRGWPGCGPHLDGDQMVNGCHWFVGTSGKLKQAERRALEARMSAVTRQQILMRGLWPKSLPFWEEDVADFQDAIFVARPEIQKLIVHTSPKQYALNLPYGVEESQRALA